MGLCPSMPTPKRFVQRHRFTRCINQLPAKEIWPCDSPPSRSSGIQTNQPREYTRMKTYRDLSIPSLNQFGFVGIGAIPSCRHFRKGQRSPSGALRTGCRPCGSHSASPSAPSGADAQLVKSLRGIAQNTEQGQWHFDCERLPGRDLVSAHTTAMLRHGGCSFVGLHLCPTTGQVKESAPLSDQVQQLTGHPLNHAHGLSIWRYS